MVSSEASVAIYYHKVIDTNFLVHKSMRHYRFKSVSNKSVFPGILLHGLCNIASATLCHVTQKGGRWGNVNGASWRPISWWWNFFLWIPLFQSNGEKLEAQALFTTYLTKLRLLLKEWRTLRTCKEPPEGERIQMSSTKLL